MRAQESLDITDLYITNAGFETGSTSGWTVGNSSDTGARSTSNATYAMTNSEGNYLFNTWWQGIPITQNIGTLPAGTYNLSAVVASDGATVYMTVNDNHDTYTETTNSEVGIEISHEFTLTEDTEVTIGIIGGADGTAGEHKDYVEGGYWWYKCDNFKLTLQVDGEIPAAIVEKLLSSNVPEGKMSDKAQSKLTSAVETLRNSATMDNYGAALQAISAANTSISSYQIIADGAVPTNSIGGWAISTAAGALACNTWSTEGNSDGSGMTTPFVQDWAASGTALGVGKLYYTLEGLNPGEKYNVNARVRVFNESAGSMEGGSFFVGDESVSISDKGTACSGDFSTKGMYGVLTLTGEVNSNGILQFGIEIASGSELNWISIKDVTISEFSGYVPTSIELDNTSLSLTTGSSATITAIVEPEEADDKTLSWTSSDSSVATVSDGVVTAVGSGTATITATANAATSVTASCSVTVVNATSVDNYSEVGEGEFYVRNVATGKFLGQGNNWDTHASLIEHGKPVTLTLSNGAYTLTGIVGTANGFGSNSFVDNNSPVTMTIEETTEGSGIYTMVYNNQYVAADAGATTVSLQNSSPSSSMAQWQFLTKEDMNKNLPTTLDATYCITGALAQQGATSNSSWTSTNVTTNYSGARSEFNAYICSESWHQDSFSYAQTDIDVPNGTYTVKVQGFINGSAEAYLKANDAQVLLKALSSESSTPVPNSRTSAATAFINGYYYNSLEVTVTDRKLNLSVEGSSADSWVAWNNFELYLQEYTPVIAIETTIDQSEIEEGNTAQITASVTPENASFDKLTYTSSDETIATVDENGQVTAVAEGEATITIAAEMEDVSATVDVTVVKPAVLPGTIAVYNGEEEVTELEIGESVTLTAVVGPEGAAQTVTFVSDNEEVVTVDANGVVTPVLPGTAHITVASTVDADVAATVAVTVVFDETELPEVTYVNDGPKRTYSELGENIIKNGSFEYPDGYYGWTNAAGGAMSSANFDIVTDGDIKYLRAKQSKGATDANSIGTGWKIESGKTYIFGYKTKNSKEGNCEYHKVTLTNTLGTETNQISDNAKTYGTDWTDISYEFTNTDGYQYLQFRARWLDNAACFDDFYLCEVVGEDVEVGNVDYITENVPTSNIGTAPFQYNQTNIDAATGLTQATSDNQYTGATVSDVEAAYNRMMTLNQPDADERYNIVVATADHAKKDNAILVKLGATSANNLTGYTYTCNLKADENLAQAFSFAPVDGKLNTYQIYYTDENNALVYLTYGTLNGSAAGWKDSQIQGTQDASAAGEFEIQAGAANAVFNIKNTLTNSTIACQAGGTIYTEAGNADFTLQLVEPALVEVAIAEGAYATRMFPFKPELSHVTFYEVEEMDGTTLVLNEVTDPQANTPYILYCDEEVGEDLEGYGTATSLDPVEKGLLVGTLAEQNTVPAGNYVLQTLTNGQKFYKVASDIENYPAYRAYLKGSEAGDGVKEIGFISDDTPTGINAISNATFDFSNIEGVYTVSGAKIGKLQNGTNVVRMKDGSVRKVLVK